MTSSLPQKNVLSRRWSSVPPPEKSDFGGALSERHSNQRPLSNNPDGAFDSPEGEEAAASIVKQDSQNIQQLWSVVRKLVEHTYGLELKMTKVEKTFESRRCLEMEREMWNNKSTFFKRLDTSHFRSFNEITDINQWRGGFLHYVFGIRQARGEKQRFQAIDPASRFNSGFALITVIALLYTMVVVPVQLSFLRSPNSCLYFPTSPIDMTVDSFFLLSMVYRGTLLGYVDSKCEYHDRVRDIALNYLCTLNGFLFDAITVMPLSYFGPKINEECHLRGRDQVPLSNLDYASFARLFRLIHLPRALAQLQTLKHVMDLRESIIYHTLGPVVYKVGGIFFVMGICIHLAACLFWRVKLETNSDEGVDAFLSNINDIDREEITSVYLLMFYFITTVTCTVGFGEFYATNNGERIVCIFLFIYSACLYGSLLAQLNAIVTSVLHEPLQKQADAESESLRTFLIARRAPRKVETRSNFYFQYVLDGGQKQEKLRNVLQDVRLPDIYRGGLSRKIVQSESRFYEKLAFRTSNEEVWTSFCAEMRLKSQQVYFANGATIAEKRWPADQIIIVVNGEAIVNFGVGEIALFTPGDVLGDSAVIGDKRWLGTFGVHPEVFARGPVTALSIALDDIHTLAAQFTFTTIKQRISLGTRAWSRRLEWQRKQTETEADGLKPRIIFRWIRSARQLLLLESKHQAAASFF